MSQQSAELEKQRRQMADMGRTAAQLAKQQSDLARKEADLQVCPATVMYAFVLWFICCPRAL